MSDQVVAEIRRLLSDDRTSTVWEHICKVIDDVAPEERGMLIEYVAQHTEGWEKSLRLPLYHWWKAHKDGHVVGVEGMIGDWSNYIWDAGSTPGEFRIVPGLPDARVVWCPPGTFLMGASGGDEEAFESEVPQHKVTLSQGFWILDAPITQAQFEVVMGFNPALFNEGEESRSNPVESVNWYEALLYCNALSARQGLQSSYVLRGIQGAPGERELSIESVSWSQPANGWRLPTEAEWEYACRAGATVARYGNLDDIAWYWKTAHQQTRPIRQKQSNDWNLFDMLGNVGEWTYDGWYRLYELDVATDPVEHRGTDRVTRGGCWSDAAREIRATHRAAGIASERSLEVGFRLVRSVAK